MKAAAQHQDVGVAQALIKGACPICALLKEFQNGLIETLTPDAGEHLCNYHAWAVAHGTPGKIAVDILDKALDRAGLNIDQGGACDICSRIQQEEEFRTREMAQELARRTNLADWMLHHGGICLNHATKLKMYLPVRLQSLVDQILRRHIAELKQELDIYRQQLEMGTKTGWGSLGKVAELMVSQRGITR